MRHRTVIAGAAVTDSNNSFIPVHAPFFVDRQPFDPLEQLRPCAVSSQVMIASVQVFRILEVFHRAVSIADMVPACLIQSVVQKGQHALLDEFLLPDFFLHPGIYTPDRHRKAGGDQTEQELDPVLLDEVSHGDLFLSNFSPEGVGKPPGGGLPGSIFLWFFEFGSQL